MDVKNKLNSLKKLYYTKTYNGSRLKFYLILKMNKKTEKKILIQSIKGKKFQYKYTFKIYLQQFIYSLRA